MIKVNIWFEIWIKLWIVTKGILYKYLSLEDKIFVNLQLGRGCRASLSPANWPLEPPDSQNASCYVCTSPGPQTQPQRPAIWYVKAKYLLLDIKLLDVEAELVSLADVVGGTETILIIRIRYSKNLKQFILKVKKVQSKSRKCYIDPNCKNTQILIALIFMTRSNFWNFYRLKTNKEAKNVGTFSG